MTIDLPRELERYVRDQVAAGRYSTVSDVVRDALERQRQAGPSSLGMTVTPDPVLGSMREDADLLDEIVEHAMRNRREQPWRLAAIE